MADIFERQTSTPDLIENRIWMKSVLDRDIGKEVEQLVQDVRRFEES